MLPSRLARILVAYLEYEQQMHVANEDGGDRVLARRRELVDSATQMMIADEFYYGKPWIDLSELELKGSKSLLALMCSRRVMQIFPARSSMC